VVKDMSNRFAWLKMLFFTLSGLVLLGSSCNPPPSEETKIEYFRIDGKDEDVTIKVDSTDKSFELSWKVSNAAKCALGLNDRINQSTIRDVLCERTETVLADSLTTYTYTLNAYKTAGSQPTTNTSRKIIVEPASANLVPVANNDIYSVAKNATLTEPADRGVLANDTNNPSSAIIVTPLSGLTLNPDGSFTYNASGVTASSVSFTYRARNSQGDSNVATVTITITPEGVTPTRVERRILSGTDDTEEEVGSGLMFPVSPDLDFGSEAAGGVKKIVGLRFVSTSASLVPKNATITNAWIQFTANDVELENRNPRIQVSLITGLFNTFSQDPFTLSNIDVPADVEKITSPIFWEPPAWNNTEEQTEKQRVDVTQLVQEAVNKSYWEKEDTIGFVFEQLLDGIRIAWSFEGAAVKNNAPLSVPTLVIEYIP
jgi:Bacterial cadherin-like domain